MQILNVVFANEGSLELLVLFFAMNGPLSAFGMIFVNVLHECTGRLGLDGFGAGCRLVNQSCIHSSSVPFWQVQCAAQDLATIC